VGDDGSSHTLVEHWNGTAWSSQSSPNGGTSANDLTGVSCVSATNCWAVGWYFDAAQSLARNLIEHWDGGAWSVATNLAGSDNSPQQNDNALFGVTCLSASYCWAVGNYQQSGQPLRTLIDQYDGTSWSLVSGTPNNAIGNATNNVLRGVGCADTGHCAAVGDVAPADLTLILMFQVAAAPTPTPSSVPVPPTGLATSGGSAGGAFVWPLAGLGAALVVAGALALRGARRRPD
jgi:hypothetical protein